MIGYHDGKEGKTYETEFDYLIGNHVVSEGKGPITGASSSSSAGDLTDQFNTPLNQDEQAAYDKKFSKKDSYDYDMQGWFKANPNVEMSEGQHFPDTFKKPNHPTFSSESKYHGGEYEGGQWSKNSDDTYTFTPGKTNIEMHGDTSLKDYFKKIEPGNYLNVPFKVAMADMAPEGMRIPVARIQQNIKDQYGGAQGGGGSFEMKRPSNENVPKEGLTRTTPGQDVMSKEQMDKFNAGRPTESPGARLGVVPKEKETVDQYINRIKDTEAYKKVVAERKAEIEKGFREGRNTKEGQIIDKYQDALDAQRWQKLERETRASHKTPYENLKPEEQEMWRKHVKDPEVRKSLGIPAGEGPNVIPFKPK